MKILITGVAGFIGSHTAEKLLEAGHSVVGIDNFDPFYDREYKNFNLASISHPEFQFIEVDIRDVGGLKNLFSSYSIDVVVHLAAKAGVRPSIEDTGSYYDVNVSGTCHLLDAMKEYNITKMVFASSSSVYGNNRKIPFSEVDVVDCPVSPYAATKKSGELLCHVYHHLYGFNISCLRFFTVYGPRQRPDLAIHKFTRLVDNSIPLPFYGDGSSLRDYTYIDDIVNGIICAINNLSGFNIYNLGESRVVSLLELVTAIESGLGKKAILDHLPFQPGDVKETFADISKAKLELGYNPMVEFETGILNFISWYMEVKGRF